MDREAARATAQAMIAKLELEPPGSAAPNWGITAQGLSLQLSERLEGRQTGGPSQGQTQLCGPAAFMFCLIKDRPDLYVDHIIQLWRNQTATLGQRSISPGAAVEANARAHASPANTAQSLPQSYDINAVDWISMASLRNDSPDLNPFSDYQHPGDAMSAITRPKYMKGWFTAAGASLLHDNTNEILALADWEELVDIGMHCAASGAGCWVVMLVAAAMFQRASDKSTRKNHWVVLNGPITVNGRPLHTYQRREKPDMATASIRARIFTWGNEEESLFSTGPQPPLSHFLKCFHGALVFSRIP